MKKLKNILIILFPHIKWIVKFKNANKKAKVNGFTKKVWAFRKGFYPYTVDVCEINSHNKHEFINERFFEDLHPINGKYSSIIDNKLFLPFLFKDYPELIPEYYFLLNKGRLIKIEKDGNEWQDVLELLKSKKILALKRMGGSQGQGFIILEHRNNQFLFNKEPVGLKYLNSFLNKLDEYLITEYVDQADYSAKINNDSVNTVRYVCARDLKKHKFFIARSYHRFGRKGSYVDNLGSRKGGISVMIDIDSGKLKNIGLFKHNGKLEKITGKIVHPDSKQIITGISIPDWNRITQRVLEFLDHMSFLKFAALDIVITNKGFKVLEINTMPDLSAIQVEGGLLQDSRLQDFFLAMNKN